MSNKLDACAHRFLRVSRCFTVVLTILLGQVFAQSPAFSVVYRFGSPLNGSNPDQPLLLHNGILYGTTPFGGSTANGLAFAVDISTGQETVLHNFGEQGIDGNYPSSGLVTDAQHNLYGVTIGGGANTAGSLYKIDSSGNESVLYSFTGGRDGALPTGRLVIGPSSNIFGIATSTGKPPYEGSAWEFTTSSTLRVLHDFGATGDGGFPVAGPLGISPYLYGTCNVGGAFNAGMIYQIDPVSKVETILYNFTGGADGASPVTSLITDGNGNLIGSGGSGGNLTNCSGNGCGVIFSLNIASGQETLLYTFEGGTDGSGPSALVRDPQGNLYGTTENGGVNGKGNVFKLDASGHFSVLYSFTGGADGATPKSGLTLGSAGTLYGTASSGSGPAAFGTVFAVTP